MNGKQWSALGVAGGVLLLGAIGLGCGKEAPAAATPVAAVAPATAPLAPQAPEQTLANMASFLGGLKAFRVDVTATSRMVDRDGPATFETSYTLAVKRPNLLALVLRRGEVNGKVVFDGKTRDPQASLFALDLISDGRDVYYYFAPADEPPEAKLEAPKDLADLSPSQIRTEWSLGLIHGEVLELAKARPGAPPCRLPEGERWQAAPPEEIGGVRCRKLTWAQIAKMPDGADMSSRVALWIEAGPKPRLLKWMSEPPREHRRPTRWTSRSRIGAWIPSSARRISWSRRW